MGHVTARRRRWPRVLGALLAVLLLLVVAVAVWASAAREAEQAPLEAALLEHPVGLSLSPDVELFPVGREPRRGVIFYPGARVSPEAYIATWAPIVQATDTLVVIPSMPLNLAVFGRSRAEALIEDRPEIDEWWVGGHSLGGAMAASWLGGQPDGQVDGLVLWASFSTRGAALEERDDLRVLSVSGSRDGRSTPQETTERHELLPDDAVTIEVEGMNHAQFGRYGDQSGDLTPTITDAEAQRLLTDAHVRLWEHAASTGTMEPS
jgi:pimeloyl-ACP methyl ester carboxylesterase